MTKRGEIAVRGGILDLFPPTAEHPYRIEFWGDEVAEIRTFAVTDQRSIDLVAEVVAPPCREVLLTPAVRAAAGALSATATGDPTLAEMLEKLSAGIAVEGMEALIPALVGAPMVLLPDLIPTGTHVLLADPEKVRSRAADLKRTGAGLPGGVLGGGGHRRQGADRPRSRGLPGPGRGVRQHPGQRPHAVAGRGLR